MQRKKLYPTPSENTRLGFHYFPDTLHYRESDLATWLPELKVLGASWLTLQAPVSRAIPEFFIQALLSAGIEPVLHMVPSLTAFPSPDEFSALLEAYAHWGVRYLCLFDQPNLRTTWPPATWAQDDLVERFLDVFIPLANSVVRAGLFPVFPPLSPGGDYWDTAFIRTALQSLSRRRQDNLLDHLVLGAYAWLDDHPLQWGMGGPERWAGARPYFTPPGEEDQCGFRIFDWYLPISRAVLGAPLPVIILKTGNQGPRPVELETWLAVAQMMVDDHVEGMEPVPPEVLACNLWLLASAEGDPYEPQTWYPSDGTISPAGNALKTWAASRGLIRQGAKSLIAGGASSRAHPIGHYLLLPKYAWGIADWHLEVIRPFVRKYQPTVGFSIDEARLAREVTVIDGRQAYTEEAISSLRAAGCKVRCIEGDGTSIATKLAAL